MHRKHRLRITWFLVLILLTGCQEKIEKATTEPAIGQAVKVSSAVAAAVKRALIYEAAGTVEPRTASTLSSKLMGTVTAVNVIEGDRVKKDDLLVVIDRRQVAANLEKAEAAFAEAKRAEASAGSSLAAAKAAFELAKTTYDRYIKLMEEQSASKQEFDEVEARYRQTKAAYAQAAAMVDAARDRVQQARAGVTAAAVRQKDASIRAPYDGVVTAKKVDVGDLAAPGVPLLSLQKQAANDVVFEVPEKYIPAIYLQQKVTVNIPSLQEKMLPAVVVRIDPSADQKSRSFRIRAELPYDKSIRSGMYAKVEMPVGETASMVIPATAVVHQGQLMGIYLVDEHQVARFRLIRTGKAFGDNVEVVSGLKDGDRYVVIPPPELSDGTKVEMTS